MTMLVAPVSTSMQSLWVVEYIFDMDAEGFNRPLQLRDNVFPFQTTCHSQEYHSFV